MKRRNEIGRIAFGVAVAAVLSLSGCSETERTEKATGGETHFLTCTTDSDCASPSQKCVVGVCRTVTAPVVTPDGSGGTSSVSAPTQCARGDVAGPQVLVLGDTFMALTHQITVELENVARARGTLPPDQSYRDQSTVLNNAFALGGSGLADQYSKAFTEAPVKVVIMNGGGSDVLQGYCATPVESCPVIVQAVDGARELFTRMASDGVEHVVYAYYPDPQIPAVKEKVDAMRPSMQAACSDSAVPCHWVDLRIPFSGHYAEYVAGDGLDPTTAGAQASALAISDTMQQHCIAQ